MKDIKAEQLPGGRLQSIDALRGIAALGVVFYHAVQQTENAVLNNLFQWPVKLIQFLSSFGYVGVFLFFVISGFCIHLQWAKSKAAGQPQQINFGSFWRRRIRRLYPPYLIALALFLALTALTVGLDATHFLVYDIVMHVLMLHNLDPQTCYSINGVFWTLAIEEQLYLAYFLLLFIRMRWGWGPTLIVCGLARVGWFFFSHFVWLATGAGIPVPEAAASHWLTWALGALAVEAWLGLVKLPNWCRNVWIGSAAILIASATSVTLPMLQKDTLIHDLSWFLMHPAWGFGFFILINRAAQAEKSWFTTIGKPWPIAVFASIGVFSYSLYLTHELVIMRSWRFVVEWLPPMLNTLFVVVPATVVFTWLFFQLFERPFMRKSSERVTASDESAREQVFAQGLAPAADEG
jgi:peptidoglycan/LPS O-acetylase OafA/YrhL